MGLHNDSFYLCSHCTPYYHALWFPKSILQALSQMTFTSHQGIDYAPHFTDEELSEAHVGRMTIGQSTNFCLQILLAFLCTTLPSPLSGRPRPICASKMALSDPPFWIHILVHSSPIEKRTDLNSQEDRPECGSDSL